MDLLRHSFTSILINTGADAKKVQAALGHSRATTTLDIYSHIFADTPLWNSKLNAKMWRMYLKGVQLGENAYASPAEAADFSGMPLTYVEVAEYDPLRDEGAAFAEALRGSGVHAELHQTRRTIHGFEIAEKNEIVLESVERRIEKLREAFAKSGTGDA